jgi:Fe2+ transport system protein FeoA
MSLLLNHTYCIIGICPEKIDRFLNMGLSVNTRITIKYIQPLNGPIIIETQGRLIALRRGEIECLSLK